MKLHLIYGLPGAGKTTLARKMQSEDPDLILINKDAIRAMIHNGVYSPDNEILVRSVQQSILSLAVASKNPVVMDDAGLLNPQTITALQEACKNVGIDWETEVEHHHALKDVPIETCIKRDLARLNSVGESVIRKMAARYLPQPKRKIDPRKKNCIVVDLDGCLSNMGDREWWDVEKSHLDTVNPHIADIVNGANADEDNPVSIVILTGRECTEKNRGREIITTWLETHGILHDGDDFLITRADGDRRPAAQFKEHHITRILNDFNILTLLDDDVTVIEMANKLGIPTIQANHLGFVMH